MRISVYLPDRWQVRGEEDRLVADFYTRADADEYVRWKSGTEAKMATEWNDWTAEKLLDSYWHGEVANADGGWTRDPSELRAELLRRLSAGNSQAEKVKCAGYFTCRNVPGKHAADCPLYDGIRTPLGEPIMANTEPERSDGRIRGGAVRVEWDTHFCAASGCEHGRSGEQRETRVQGEKHPTDTLRESNARADARYMASLGKIKEATVRDMDALSTAYLLDGVAGIEQWEAQRSAGRIEAGSEQGCTRCHHATPHKRVGPIRDLNGFKHADACEQCDCISEPRGVIVPNIEQSRPMR